MAVHLDVNIYWIKLNHDKTIHSGMRFAPEEIMKFDVNELEEMPLQCYACQKEGTIEREINKTVFILEELGSGSEESAFKIPRIKN
jgi:hypothetical protein